MLDARSKVIEPLDTTFCGCTAPSANMFIVLPSKNVRPDITFLATS